MMVYCKKMLNFIKYSVESIELTVKFFLYGLLKTRNELIKINNFLPIIANDCSKNTQNYPLEKWTYAL